MLKSNVTIVDVAAKAVKQMVHRTVCEPPANEPIENLTGETPGRFVGTLEGENRTRRLRTDRSEATERRER